MSVGKEGRGDRHGEAASAGGAGRLGERRLRPEVDLDLAEEEEALADEVLLDRVGQGDEPAFLELYRRHHELAWRVARTTAAADDEAMAAVVDAFLQLPDIAHGVGRAGAGTGREPASARAVLAAAVRDAARERGSRRRSVPHPTGRQLVDADSEDGDGEVIDLSSEFERSDGELLQTLRTVVSPPPPELWALVYVAWNDRIPQG